MDSSIKLLLFIGKVKKDEQKESLFYDRLSHS